MNEKYNLNISGLYNCHVQYGRIFIVCDSLYTHSCVCLCMWQSLYSLMCKSSISPACYLRGRESTEIYVLIKTLYDCLSFSRFVLILLFSRCGSCGYNHSGSSIQIYIKGIICWIQLTDEHFLWIILCLCFGQSKTIKISFPKSNA